jgi:hypothetical protein
MREPGTEIRQPAGRDAATVKARFVTLHRIPAIDPL